MKVFVKMAKKMFLSKIPLNTIVGSIKARTENMYMKINFCHIITKIALKDNISVKNTVCFHLKLKRQTKLFYGDKG